MITVKSTQEGLEFWIESSMAYPDIKEELFRKLGENKAFYRGMKLPAIFFGKHFTDLQKKEISGYFYREFQIQNTVFAEEEEKGEPERPMPPQPQDSPKDGVERMEIIGQEGESLFVRSTVRGGQRMESKGDIVVLGDVNPGAELIAGGNIAVFGKLRGLAHAGASGRRDVCIAANYLLPQQVRICGKIAIIPKDREIEGPEVVYLQDGKVVVDQVG